MFESLSENLHVMLILSVFIFSEFSTYLFFRDIFVT